MALDSSNAMLVDCTFAGQNAADWGGGMFMARGQATIINTRFTENHADRGGGAIHAVDSADPVLANCTFIGNDAVDYGGALNNGWPGYAANHADVRSCTFIGNSAAGGGAIRLAGTSELVVSNSIIWGNTSQIAEDGSVLPVVDYCDVQGGHTGTGNIDADPMCVDGRPQADSPCLDAGDSNALPADVADLDDDGNTTEPLPLDLDGNPRAADDPGAPGTGTGGCPIVDMGAFERPGGAIGCCAADVTGPAGVPDDNVDALDYLLLIAQWGSPCTGSCEADITGPAGAPDGNVDALDYLMLIAQWSSPADCH